MSKTVWLAVVCQLLFISQVIAQEWPQFRGPAGDGHATGTQLLARWSETENVAWKAALPGKGWSSPVVGNGLIWVTAAETAAPSKDQLAAAQQKLAGNPLAKEMEIAGETTLVAIGMKAADGSIVKKVELFKLAKPEAVHSLNSYASPSPILDQNRLYCHFGTWGTACVDVTTGKILWKKVLAIQHSVGPGSSPALFENLLIIPCDGTDAQFVAALDKLTGDEVWRTKRPAMTGSQTELHKAFCTPLVIDHQGEKQVVIPGAQWVVSYNPKTGVPLWQVRYGDGFSNAPRPIYGHGMVYICTGYMAPELWAIKVDGAGDVSSTHVAWKIKQQVPSMSSPILVGDEVYFVSEGGILSCVEALTGQSIWKERIRGSYSASPLFADGKLYFCNREGETVVLQPGRKHLELARNTLDGQLMASPAIVNGGLLLRSQSHLYCLKE